MVGNCWQATLLFRSPHTAPCHFWKVYCLFNKSMSMFMYYLCHFFLNVSTVGEGWAYLIGGYSLVWERGVGSISGLCDECTALSIARKVFCVCIVPSLQRTSKALVRVTVGFLVTSLAKGPSCPVTQFDRKANSRTSSGGSKLIWFDTYWRYCASGNTQMGNGFIPLPWSLPHHSFVYRVPWTSVYAFLNFLTNQCIWRPCIVSSLFSNSLI